MGGTRISVLLKFESAGDNDRTNKMWLIYQISYHWC